MNLVDILPIDVIMRIQDEERQMATPVYWLGIVPDYCEMSERKIEDRFVDGPSLGTRGPWAILHPTYFEGKGGVYGQGRGQLYEKQPDMRWKKIAG